MKKISNKTGEKHITKEGYEIEIIEYFNYCNCTIRFKNGIVLKNKRYANILSGKIKNPYHPSIFGIGCIGEGKHDSLSKPYKTWFSMMQRCYSKQAHKKYPSYGGNVVIEKWNYFQNFAKWYEENWKPWMDNKWQLDKDILISGNKVYSPETCCFVPQDINKLFTKSNSSRGEYPIGVNLNKNGRFNARLRRDNKEKHLGYFDTIDKAFEMYKTAKEEHIKEVADKWKPFITPETYQAMYNYQVEITD